MLYTLTLPILFSVNILLGANAAADVKNIAAMQAGNKAKMELVQAAIKDRNYQLFFDRYSTWAMNDEERQQIWGDFFAKVKPNEIPHDYMQPLMHYIHKLYRDNHYGRVRGQAGVKTGVLDEVVEHLPDDWKKCEQFMQGIQVAHTAVAPHVKAPALAQPISEEVVVKRDAKGIQASWQELHPYEMVRNIAAYYKTLYPQGLPVDDQLHLMVRCDLAGYSDFNFALAIALLVIDHRKDAEKYEYTSWQQFGVLLNVVDSPLLSVRERKIIRNILECGHGAIRRIAYQKAIDTFRQDMPRGVGKVTGVPKDLAQLILGYAAAYPWGARLAQIVSEGEAYRTYQYYGHFWNGLLCNLSSCMLQDLTGIEGFLGDGDRRSRIHARDNFLTSFVIEEICTEEIDLAGNFLQELKISLPSLKLIDLNKNNLEVFPPDLLQCAGIRQILLLQNPLRQVPASLFVVPERDDSEYPNIDLPHAIFPHLRSLHLDGKFLSEQDKTKHDNFRWWLNARIYKMDGNPLPVE